MKLAWFFILILTTVISILTVYYKMTSESNLKG